MRPAQPMGQTKDMGVYSNGVDPKTISQEDISGLSTHTRQLHQEVPIRRNGSSKVPNNNLRARNQIAGLAVKKPAILDQPFNFWNDGCGQVLRCGISRKYSRGNHIDPFIRALRR